jgi:signal transduction histidine kinase/CheY-like chemotaxis protein
LTQRGERSAQEVALLGEKEALQRLDLLATASRILDATMEDYEQAVLQVADACVPDFADLCAIEVIGPNGDIYTAAYRVAHTSGLSYPDKWVPIGRLVAPDRRPVLTFSNSDEVEHARAIRQRFSAQSLIVAPIAGSGITLGWFVAATGNYRRGFRPSALRIGVELSSRLGATIQRVLLHREMQAAAREQNRAVRRLRRLATAATNLAGAASTEAVLRVACIEACVIQEADGAIARWWMADGTVVSAQTGEVDFELAETAFEAVTNRRTARGRGWVAHPLPSSDPWQHAALVVFVANDLATDEELVLSSLASLIPVAFERALGTETVVMHEARLRAVVEASPVALIGVRPDGAVTLANRAAQLLFQWVTDPTEWALTESIRPGILDLAASVRETGTVVNRTFSVDGFDLSVSGAPLPATSPSDEQTVLVAGVDLSEVRRAERALVQAQRLEAMGVVAGRVAHDFNNLLTLIIGYTELLARGLVEDQQQALVTDIEGAARRAARLTQQMLGMTRRESTATVADLGAELANMQAVLTRLAGPKVALTVSTPEAPVKVRVDPSEFEQIVINLVVNACDAMEGEGRLDVSLTIGSAGSWLPDADGADRTPGPAALLTIADNGPGMPPEVLARCLEPFFTTKRRGQGSGLGMSTVYGLVTERGGHMDIDSDPTGTRVKIWLPQCEDSPITTSDDGETWPPGQTIAGRVLLVEDEPDLRLMGQHCLASIGLDVVVAESAEFALFLLTNEGPFDALVTDIMLPGMSGVELAEAVRRVHPMMPVLFMTGYAGSPTERGMPGPDANLLRKPYRPDALRVRVADMLQEALQGSKR